ncbi:hypothetical protein KQI82_14540 [Oscillibacter sp. MSJ-2]|uniref:WG repeat-containing protein n=1 Tax=Dysosmobacter acutus TaxID=2841504 RepID=A0ABS6FCW6_9FIRM|nr:hypothetical protein [Dysosmobacter acutus]MBU5628128.1 hypothetical protein [Dysosmobacter acutus]
MKKAALAAALCLLLTACSAGSSSHPLEPGQDGLRVHTDWSQLDKRRDLPQPVGSRWYAEYTDHLIPREDYGQLIPYAGLRLMDDWPARDGCLYGLMTREGKVVSDPVYSAVYRPGGYDASGRWQPLPLLILEQGDPSAEEGSWDPSICAVAAGDGRWCTPFDYRTLSAGAQGLLLFQPDSFTVMAPDGAIRRVWTVEEMGISQGAFDSLLSDVVWGEGIGGEWVEDYMAIGWEEDRGGEALRAFDLVTGEIRVFTMETWIGMGDQLHEMPEEPGPAVPNADRLRDQLLGDDAPGLLVVADYATADAPRIYYREDGTPLPQFTLYGNRWYEQVSVVGGLIEVLDWNTASYYDLDTLECRFRTYLGYEND